MDGTSDHPLTNRAAVAEFLRLQNLITQVQSTTATTSRRGLAQLSTATSITDVNAYALSATEKNPSIKGSLASQIAISKVRHGHYLLKDVVTMLNGYAFWDDYKYNWIAFSGHIVSFQALIMPTGTGKQIFTFKKPELKPLHIGLIFCITPTNPPNIFDFRVLPVYTGLSTNGGVVYSGSETIPYDKASWIMISGNYIRDYDY